MPRGYRLLLAALVGWLVLSNQCEAKQQSQADQQQTAAQSTAAPTPKLKPNELKQTCDGDNPKYDPGVCASLRQAEAAEEANRLSAIAIRWNKAGIAAVVATLVATAWAAYAASSAAKAARITIKGIEALERARLIVVPPDRLEIGDNGDGTGSRFALIGTKNLGRSQATVKQVRWAGTASKAWHTNFADMAPRSDTFRAVVTQGTHIIGSLNFDAVAGCKLVAGEVIYDTLFAGECMTRFLWRIGSEDDRGDTISVWPMVLGDDWPDDT